MTDPSLPSGRTQDRLNRASPADFASLPEDELDRVLEHINARHGTKSDAERKAEFKSQLRQRQNAARVRHGMPPRPETIPPAEAVEQPQRPLPTTSQLVEVVEREGYQDDWGFVLFRTDYSDESRWERFEEGFNNLIDKSIEEDEEGSTGIGRIERGLMVKMVVDEELERARVEDIRRHFQAVKEAGEVPGGLDVSMCLIVDKAAIASIADNEPLPFVVAVDVHHDPTDENHEEGYEGYFKVAISSLLPDFYPPLASQGLTPDELWPFAKPIFKDAYGLGE